MVTDWPRYLREVAMGLRTMGFPISAPSLEQLAAAWDAERAQAAADRAALEQAREILALNTGIDFLDACRDLRAAVDIMHNNRHALERAKALLAEIESEARKQIANPNSNASQMVVAEAIGETCRRIANTLDNTQ